MCDRSRSSAHVCEACPASWSAMVWSRVSVSDMSRRDLWLLAARESLACGGVGRCTMPDAPDLGAGGGGGIKDHRIKCARALVEYGVVASARESTSRACGKRVLLKM